MKPVSLQAVVDEMDVIGYEMTSYINKKTGELFTVSDEEASFIKAGEAVDDLMTDWRKEMPPKVREVLESGDSVEPPVPASRI